MSDKLKDILQSMQNVANKLMKRAPGDLENAKKNIAALKEEKKVPDSLKKAVDNVKKIAPDQIKKIKKSIETMTMKASEQKTGDKVQLKAPEKLQELKEKLKGDDKKDLIGDVKKFVANFVQQISSKKPEGGLDKLPDDKKNSKEGGKNGTKKYSSKPLAGAMETFQKPDIVNFVEKMKGKSGSTSPFDGDATPSSSSRRMKYPYTFSAKIAQFPFKFYYNNMWMWKYYFYGIIVSIPIFYKFERMSKTESNVQKWADICRREEEELRQRHH